MPSTELIILIVIAFVLFYVFTRVIRVVPQYERLVVLFLGRYAGTRGPGLVIVLPILETAYKVDIRERFLDIPSQTAITQDNAPIAIDFLVYYRVVDEKRATLDIDHVVSATINMATTTLRAVIGDIVLDDVLSKREQINDTLRVKLDEITERWGVKVTSVEIREIEPPRDVQDAMNRQMSAERERRAAVTRANGEREAAISIAEGERQAAVLRAEGEKQSSILKAEGERQSQLLRAQGFAKALEAITAEAQGLDQNTMMLQYLDALQAIGRSPSTKFILPMEITGMMQQLADVATRAGNGLAARTEGNGSSSSTTSTSTPQITDSTSTPSAD
jgi:regulator of protease activity HflC (stomatin/prohibitin superfamily)